MHMIASIARHKHKHHGLRRHSRPSPVIHVRRRAVEALRAVVLIHAKLREETLLLLALLQFVELVVRLGQPLDVPRAAAVELSLAPPNLL